MEKNLKREVRVKTEVSTSITKYHQVSTSDNKRGGVEVKEVRCAYCEYSSGVEKDPGEVSYHRLDCRLSGRRRDGDDRCDLEFEELRAWALQELFCHPHKTGGPSNQF